MQDERNVMPGGCLLACAIWLARAALAGLLECVRRQMLADVWRCGIVVVSRDAVCD